MRASYRWLYRIKSFSLALGFANHVHWYHCDQCERPTPWHVDAWHGVYHCLNCHTDRLGDDEAPAPAH